jgi:hypothetical protein
MSQREAIGKKLRFEVFKRDSFTCQYCGRKAPEAVLHCDHIKAVAKGGKSDILNLVTSCEACNLGKGARALSDDTVVAKQHAQLDDLQQRREQLEMMLEWRDGLVSTADSEVEALAERLTRWNWKPSENGKNDLRKWIKKYGLADTLAGADESFSIHVQYSDGKVTRQSWEYAFGKIPTFANLAKSARTKPYMPKLAYIQGILRNRLRDPYGKFIEGELEDMHVDWGVDLETLERLAKQASRWGDWWDSVVEVAQKIQEERRK